MKTLKISLNSIDKESAANFIGVAQEVVIYGNRCRRSSTLDCDRHSEFEGRIHRHEHFLHGFLNRVEPLMIWRR